MAAKYWTGFRAVLLVIGLLAISPWGSDILSDGLISILALLVIVPYLVELVRQRNDA